MTNNKNQVMAMMSAKIDDDLNIDSKAVQSLCQSTAGDYTNHQSLSCYKYWYHDYYPTIIHDSYPVYIQERAKDKGKQAFEIIKVLKDKRIIKLETVGDFIDAMDELIKIL